MPPAQVAHIMSLVEAYADSTHISSHENCLAARAAVEAALRDAPQAEPVQTKGAWRLISADTICDLIEKHRLKATNTTETFKDESLHQLLRDVVDAALEALAIQVWGSEQPAFHGFMDEESCCVHLCFTPHAPRLTDGKFATAYYTVPLSAAGEKL